MRRIFYLAAIALGLGTSASVLAQGGGTGMGGGTGAGGGGSTFGGGSGGAGGSTFGGGSGGSSFSGGTGGNSFTGGTQSFVGGTGGSTGGTGGAGGRTGVGGGTGSGTTFTPSPTGIFAAYYTNPLYPGRPGSTNLSNKIVGGFGQPSFGTTTTTTQRTTTGTGLAGRNGTATVNNQNQNRTQSITPITYAMEVRFPAPVIVPARLQTDLQGLISRTSSIGAPTLVRVEVAGTTVILRGRVANEDERRLVEGMVRLEPGVHAVQNELTIP